MQQCKQIFIILVTLGIMMLLFMIVEVSLTPQNQLVLLSQALNSSNLFLSELLQIHPNYTNTNPKPQSISSLSETMPKDLLSLMQHIPQKGTGPRSNHTLESLKDRWQNTFYKYFLIHYILSPNGTQSMDRTPHNETINRLLSNTLYFFSNEYSYTFVSYKAVLAIRRYIMILHKYNIIKSDDYLALIALFTQYFMQYIEDSNDHKYFLIHVSKSAGTAICDTASNKMKYNAKSGPNCNLSPFLTPMKSDDSNDMSCLAILSLSANGKNKYNFFASERPLMGNKISSIPNLCQHFKYILPIRNIEKRIASNLGEWNTNHYFPFQFLVKYKTFTNIDIDIDIVALKSRVKRQYKLSCIDGIIAVKDEDIYSLNGSIVYHMYASPNKGHYFDSFISSIFAYERMNTTESLLSVPNGRKCVKHMHIGGQTQKWTEKYVLQWFGDKQYGKYLIKTPINYKYRDNIDLIRGYSSNIYTRFLGFNRSKDGGSYDALFAKSWHITQQHLMNAIQFMMMTDYVLPFDDSKNGHKMWKHSYQQILKHAPRRATKSGWATSAIAKNGGRNGFASSDIVNSWNNHEWNVLKEKNRHDHKLLNLAYIIADVDVDIYDRVNINIDVNIKPNAREPIPRRKPRALANRSLNHYKMRPRISNRNYRMRPKTN